MTESAMERLYVVLITQTSRYYFALLLENLNKKTRTNQVIAKWYGPILTCLFSLPLHIQQAGDLLTDRFILALCRFRLRREINPNLSQMIMEPNFVSAQ